MGGEGKSETVSPRRWLVTIGALALYFVGGRIPLPGVDMHAWGGDVAPALSLFALGVAPIVGALGVMELARLAFPSLARWRTKGPRQTQLYLRIARALALGLAALQAMGIAAALEAAHIAIDGGGWSFRLEIVVALVGATAVMIWLAGLINAEGVGDGLVLLFSTVVARDAPHEIARWWEYARTGLSSPDAPVLLLALTILSVAALVAVRHRGKTGEPLDLWSPLLAWALMRPIGALMSGLQMRVVASIEEAGRDVGPVWQSPLGTGGTALNALAFAALIALVALRRAQVDRLDRTGMFRPQLGVEIIVCSGGRLLMSTGWGVSGAIGLGAVLCVVAALSVLPGWRGGRALAPG